METSDGQQTEQKTNPTPAGAYPFGKGAYSKEHLDYTIKTFQPYYKYPLSYQDAAEIVYNTLDFVSVLKAHAGRDKK